MSKVYIVTEGEYSDYHIEAVFSNREQAEMYVTCNTKRYSLGDTYDEYEIEEYDVDEVVYPDKAIMYIEFIATEKMNLLSYKQTISIEKLNERSMSRVKDCFGRTLFIGYVRVNSFDIPEEKKLKIIHDKLAKFKAEKEGV